MASTIRNMTGSCAGFLSAQGTPRVRNLIREISQIAEFFKMTTAFTDSKYLITPLNSLT